MRSCLKPSFPSIPFRPSLPRPPLHTLSLLKAATSLRDPDVSFVIRLRLSSCRLVRRVHPYLHHRCQAEKVPQAAVDASGTEREGRTKRTKSQMNVKGPHAVCDLLMLRRASTFLSYFPLLKRLLYRIPKKDVDAAGRALGRSRSPWLRVAEILQFAISRDPDQPNGELTARSATACTSNAWILTHVLYSQVKHVEAVDVLYTHLPTLRDQLLNDDDESTCLRAVTTQVRSSTLLINQSSRRS